MTDLTIDAHARKGLREQISAAGTLLGGYTVVSNPRAFRLPNALAMPVSHSGVPDR